MTVIWILLALLLLALCACTVCFLMVFYSAPRKESDEITIPFGEIYEEYREVMVDWVKKARAMPHRDVIVTSFDGLTLRGKFYEYAKGAPIEILFHGYRGNAERDLSGGVVRCALLGHSALIVDHRASGKSDGRVITFGVRESQDCDTWVSFVLREIDPCAKIILTGISMGAATVLIASQKEYPKNVVGVLADCGYTSAKEIIRKVIADLHLPPALLYPFVRLSARLFGGFDPESLSPIEAMKHCRLPVLFYHGDTDAFVPCEMSEKNYNACVSPKKELIIIPGAGHGLCFPKDRERYLLAARAFFDPLTSPDK